MCVLVDVQDVCMYEICVYMSVCASVYVSMLGVHLFVCMCIYVRVCVCVCVCVYVCVWQVNLNAVHRIAVMQAVQSKNVSLPLSLSLTHTHVSTH